MITRAGAFLLFLAATHAPGITVDQILAFRTAADPEISPDGTRVAYTAGGDIRIVEIASGSDTTAGSGASPQWRPDGRAFAFLRNRQIWTSDPAVQLTQEPRAIERFEWSPDGSRIAYLITFPGSRKPNEPTLEGVNNLPRGQIKVVDIRTKAVTTVTSPEYSALGNAQWFPDGFSWSPDSKRLAFTHRPHSKPGSHHWGDLAAINADGTRLEFLLNRPGFDGFPRWSPVGGVIAFISTGRYDWVRISNLYSLDLATRKARNLSAEFDESVKEFHWQADGRRIFFIAMQGTATQLFTADPHAGGVRQLSRGSHVLSQLSISRDGRTAAFLLQHGSQPAEVHVSPLDAWKPRRLSGAAVTTGLSPIESEILRWRSFDGMEIEGVLYKPARYKTGNPYPLLVIPHGGPHSVSTHVFPGGATRLFTERGWAVFLPNFRGSGGYGERFLRANLYGWGLGDYQDLMTGVDHLIARGIAHPERLAISGSSYGGYMTAWTVSQTSRFKAAVAGCGITDVPSFMRTTDVPDRFADYLGLDDRLYARHSPMTYGANITTPTLIWHGDADERVPLMQSRHLYTQLLKNRTPTELVIYHGEAHGARRADVRRDLLEREWRWITRWIQ
ncbi:MAG: S9 family peptidase [Acidobacteria bacterium]|nr:S9 family peptidase [Acidobacteriota bacterium]